MTQYTSTHLCTPLFICCFNINERQLQNVSLNDHITYIANIKCSIVSNMLPR